MGAMSSKGTMRGRHFGMNTKNSCASSRLITTSGMFLRECKHRGRYRPVTGLGTSVGPRLLQRFRPVQGCGGDSAYPTQASMREQRPTS